MPLGLVVGCVLLAAPSVEASSQAFSKAYFATFDRVKAVELSDTQTRVTRLGAAGKKFQPTLDALRKRQGELLDLLVTAVRAKEQGVAEKKAARIDEGTRVIAEVDVKAASVQRDLAQFNEQLTAAGAPLIDPGPPRDPNARD